MKHSWLRFLEFFCCFSALLSLSSCETTTKCKEFSDELLIQASIAHIRSLYGNEYVEHHNFEFVVNRQDRCEYLVIVAVLPDTPGAWIAVHLDSHGNVVRAVPGH
jgi:hypothetical protein